MLNFPKWKIFFINIVLAICLLICIPNFLPINLGTPKMSLGLDLQGGSHLVMQVNFEEYMQGQMENLVDTARRTMREAKIGYKDLKHENNLVTFELREPEKLEEVRAELIKTAPYIMVTNSGNIFTINYSPKFILDKKKQLIEQSIEIIRRRVDETGTKEPIIQRQGDDRILLQVPGVDNPQEIKKRINTTAKLTFHLVKGAEPVVKEKPPEPGNIILPDNEGKFWEIEKHPLLTGENLTNATQSYDSYNNVAVAFSLDTIGGKIFGDVTKANVGKRFAAVLDNIVINAPVIREPILGGSGQITGGFSVEEADTLSSLLRAGALPASLKILEERTVGASLGADSIKAGKTASMAAIILVAAFMIVSYGWFGVVSVIAVIFNVIIVIACLTIFHSTLTLPGIAGIALTVGMAVDANVLIFERMREEQRHAKTALQCIEQGYDKAFATIIDSHFTGLFSSLLLFTLGSGPVKGFALTLTIGIISSLFTSISVSKMIISIWYRYKRPKKISI